MRKLYALAVLSGLSLLTFGQTKPATNDPEAKKVLDAVSAKFKTFTSVQAGFAYKVEDSKGKVMSTKAGTIWMKGNKYKVSFGGQEIFSDGKTVWNYDKSSNEVTISTIDAAGGGITPQKLFTNFYDNDFLYLLNGEKKIGAKTVQEIEMTPTDKSKTFHKVYLQVDKTAKTIYSTKVLENAGNKYTYTVSSMKTNGAMADNVFVFDKKKYPGVEEVDLR
ncbi:MAG: outer membrane lipoprotein carrier protein LolA [Bacteroidota bacterium]